MLAEKTHQFINNPTMEAREKKKEVEEENGIVVEAKKLLCLQTKDGVILMELHKHWERDVNLRFREARWIVDGLLERKRLFGEYRRNQNCLEI